MVGRRERDGYFKRMDGDPEPLVVRVKRRVSLNEVDILGIVWHGRYAVFFEQGAEELGRQCGLSYRDFRSENLRAPIVQHHVDYHLPLVLSEEFTIKASLIWYEGAILNTEFELVKEDSRLATTGYTVQMFTDGTTGESCIISPRILERCRGRWKAGEFRCLQ